MEKEIKKLTEGSTPSAQFRHLGRANVTNPPISGMHPLQAKRAALVCLTFLSIHVLPILARQENRLHIEVEQNSLFDIWLPP